MANLNKEQAEAVRHKDGPCLCLAGPGSGKTFTLVERIKYLIENERVDPRSILVITFSKKAALHMQRRFEKGTGDRGYPVYFGTFHSVFYSIVKRQYKLNDSCILTSAVMHSIIRSVIKRLGINVVSDEFRQELLNNIMQYKSYVLANDDVKKRDEFLLKLYPDEVERKEFLKIYNEYIRECISLKKIDFEDMLYMCRDILKMDYELLKMYQKLYSYILVDEFQDINDVQYEVLKMLAGDKCNIFAVGDDDQAIYGFRGSKSEYVKRFIDEHANITVIDMYKNYRCATCVVEVAGTFVKNNKNRIEKRQKACKKDRDIGSVTVQCFGSEEEEAEFVISEIRRLVADGENDFAVLYRTAKCADGIEEKLKFAGLKYSRKMDKNSYYEKEWIKDIVTYFRIALGDNRDELIYRIINRPDRNMMRDDTEAINGLKERIRCMSNMSGYAALTYVFKGLEYEKYLNSLCMRKGFTDEEISEIKNELINKSRNYSSIKRWIDSIEALSTGTKKSGDEENISNSSDDRKIRIQLMTAHASKGLEFNTVFIIGLQEGIFPHRKAVTADEIEEERRLLYVAMTRAKSNLYVIGRGHEKYGKRISSFVGEISEKYSGKDSSFEV